MDLTQGQLILIVIILLSCICFAILLLHYGNSGSNSSRARKSDGAGVIIDTRIYTTNPPVGLPEKSRKIIDGSKLSGVPMGSIKNEYGIVGASLGNVNQKNQRFNSLKQITKITNGQVSRVVKIHLGGGSCTLAAGQSVILNNGDSVAARDLRPGQTIDGEVVEKVTIIDKPKSIKRIYLPTDRTCFFVCCGTAKVPCLALFEKN